MAIAVGSSLKTYGSAWEKTKPNRLMELSQLDEVQSHLIGHHLMVERN